MRFLRFGSASTVVASLTRDLPARSTRLSGRLIGMFMFVATVALAAPTVTNAATSKAKAAMPDDFSGTWIHDMFSGILPVRSKPTDKVFTLNDGTVIPLRPEAEKVYRERAALGMTDQPFANTASRCLPIGTPGNMMGAPYPVQFVQRPEFIAILFEEGWYFRDVYMNSKHPEEVIPSFMGHSIGHWEGKTLVIDTVSLRDETTLDFNGLPHSTEMHLIERITRTKPDTLTDVIEINDPVMYTKPFKLTTVFKKTNEQMIEYICEDTRLRENTDGRQNFASPK